MHLFHVEAVKRKTWAGQPVFGKAWNRIVDLSRGKASLPSQGGVAFKGKKIPSKWVNAFSRKQTAGLWTVSNRKRLLVGGKTFQNSRIPLIPRLSAFLPFPSRSRDPDNPLVEGNKKFYLVLSTIRENDNNANCRRFRAKYSGEIYIERSGGSKGWKYYWHLWWWSSAISSKLMIMIIIWRARAFIRAWVNWKLN